jgi:hypothetical protein
MDFDPSGQSVSHSSIVEPYHWFDHCFGISAFDDIRRISPWNLEDDLSRICTIVELNVINADEDEFALKRYHAKINDAGGD